MANQYTPKPIDISEQTLPDGLKDLSELIAKNTHDIWAEARIKEGWIYGPERNDFLKTHPDLIPYDELSEEEKEYDRRTALDTLKLIQKLGYEITRRSDNSTLNQ